MDYKIKIAAVIIVLTSIIYGFNYFVLAGPKQYNDITVTGFYEKSKLDNGIFLLDVRSPDEYREMHVPATDRLIPVSELKKRITELKGLEDKEVYVICRSGRRSKAASEILAENGFKKVFNIMGGILEYKKMNYPIEQGGVIP
ncbi:MAG: rhodanese-like domain-containing protein [Nitrospirae bacterium]|nr:rhodanese-like domain-containing protein [Nitrospirota bacterium]